MDVRMLVPKDKFDVSGISALKQLTNEQILPIVPELLEWVQDGNWPVAEPLFPVLAQFHQVVMPEVKRLLQASQTDCGWKYWLVFGLLPLLPNESVEVIFEDIERIAECPTENEILECVQEAAMDYLALRGKQP